MSMLEVKGLRKVYASRLGTNKVEALKNVNFTVEEGVGVVVVLLGAEMLSREYSKKKLRSSKPVLLIIGVTAGVLSGMFGVGALLSNSLLDAKNIEYPLFISDSIRLTHIYLFHNIGIYFNDGKTQLNIIVCRVGILV